MNTPVFAETDLAAIEARVLSKRKALTGDDLKPADPRRIHLKVLLAQIVQLRRLIQHAGLQNLLMYATEDESVEAIGALKHLPRLPAQAATTIMEVEICLPGGVSEVIEAGFLFSGGDLLWAVDEDTTVESGTYEIPVTCTTTGTIGNGYVSGQIDTQVTPREYIVSAENDTTTAGGAAEEDIESYKARLAEAPHGFAVAGPRGAYRVIAKAANSNIEAVQVCNKEDDDNGKVSDVVTIDDGEVYVFVLQKRPDDDPEEPFPTGGTPLTDVEDALDEDEVRPLTDDVHVTNPVPKNFTIDIDYYINRSDSGTASTIQAAVNQAVTDYLSWQTKTFGRDVNPDELTRRVKEAGAKRVIITEPEFDVVLMTEIPQLVTKTVNYMGIEDD